MPLLDEILQNSEPEQARKARAQHPEGWEPSVEFRGDVGTIVARPVEAGRRVGERPEDGVDWDEEFRHWDLDPRDWEILQPIEFRMWDAAIGMGETKRMRYLRAKFVRRSAVRDQDFEELKKQIARHKKRPRPVIESDVALVAVWADLQLGKDDGDGVEGTAGRALDCIDLVLDRKRELQRAGMEVDTLYTPSLGDIIENCSGHYAQQNFRVQLNLRDQRKVARRIFVKATSTWAKHFGRIVVPVVGGNHGENRNSDGQSYTDFADNHDVALWEEVQEIMHSNTDAYEHVSFVIPNRRLDVTLDVKGTICTFVHGHQFTRGQDVQKKAFEWWRGQMEGQQPAGDADLLLSGHYHHLQVVRRGRRTWIQAPALEGGSEWWRNQTGLEGPPGMLTLTVGGGDWDNLKVLGPTPAGLDDQLRPAS